VAEPGHGPTLPNADQARPAPLPVIHADARCLAVHKPAGLLVHRTALDAHETDDLVTRLRAQLGAPVWPVHRLDKGTSGLLLLALDADAARLLGAAFADGSADKHYRALVRGWPAEAGEINQPLARDPELPSSGQLHLAAATRWQLLQRLDWPLVSHPNHPSTRLALVAVQPLSGRRHQIRRHFKTLAHPLIGDATHGKGPLNRAVAAHIGLNRLWLHAERLTVPHPDGGPPLQLHCPAGDEWARLTAHGAAPAGAAGQPKRSA
jgi:tRNA pseudouridine65 synthase